ncbi:MAG TPA: hypothetical protein DDW15_09240, partial [Subdoligranulum sp.]|nr:hypothetical protein [Subdoligranulum sp.]
PPRGKLSPKVTDEGRADQADPFTGNRSKPAPHPAQRGHLPPSGEGKAKANKISRPAGQGGFFML